MVGIVHNRCWIWLG